MSNYLRRHHLGLVAIFIALSGTAVAAFDPVGSDGDIDACVDKKTKQLTLAKQNCKKGTKAVSWSATGPAGPAGATGPQGETGPQGATGAAGTARGYGLVQPSGFLSNSRNATVSHPATGVYCVAVTGASPATDVILVSAEYGTISQGIATLQATDETTDDPLNGGSSEAPLALWDAAPDTCLAGSYEIQTAEQRIDTNSHDLTMFNISNAGFTFVVP